MGRVATFEAAIPGAKPKRRGLPAPTIKGVLGARKGPGGWRICDWTIFSADRRTVLEHGGRPESDPGLSERRAWLDKRVGELAAETGKALARAKDSG